MVSDSGKTDQEELAFTMVGASIWEAIGGLTQARLISLQFMQRAISANPPELDLRMFHLYDQEQRRCALIASVGALDSFLADSLAFLFLRHPEVTPPNFRRRPEEAEDGFVKRILRAMGPPKKLSFLTEYLGLDLGDSLEILTAFFKLRNKIVHQSGFYAFSRVEPDGRVWATAQEVPAPSSREVQQAQVLVREVSDAIFVTMFLKMFNKEPPVRPVTPEISAAHQQLRGQWAAELQAPPEIERHDDPQWQGWRHGEGWYLTEKTRSFLITYTGIEQVPALIMFRRNDVHGTTALVSVDDGEPIRIDAPGAFRQLLCGSEVIVTFREIPFEGSRTALFSLRGFKEAWDDLGRCFREGS